jgi:N-acetylmuramoyl-L-alanine amidase
MPKVDRNVDVLNNKKLCALVIGHKKGSPGAGNTKSNLWEFDFNEDLALRIEKIVDNTQMLRVYRRTYKEFPDDINALEPDFIVSLHCNAFNQKTSGTEVLYHHKSEKGKKMAEVLQNHLVDFLKLPNRGVKPKTAEDRGGYLLCYTKAPCVIAEPFFIDNDNDLAKAQENLEGLAEIYAKAIDDISSTVFG